jgi:small subunit ribosomal protein S6
MRRYETVFIVNSELAEEQQQSLFDKLKGLVSEDQGMLVKFDEWGHKRLAYEIKKQSRGYYVLMDLCGDGALVKEIERNMRLDDRVLKYMTVLKEKAVDMEAVKAEIEVAEAQESKSEPAQEAADEPAQEAADEPSEEAADEPAQETAGEREEKADSESTETAETPLSESEAPERTTESSDQEEQEDGTK